MKTFKEYMSEETNPFALSNGFVGVNDEKVRDNINALLSGITMKPFLTPHIALERVSKVLANYHIYLPKQTFEDIDDDYVVYEVNQFGEKSGMTNDGEVVTKMSDPYYIYFEYKLNESGSYDVFCEIVDSDELEELTNEADDEEEDEEDAEELDENYHPSYTSAIKTAVDAARKRGYEIDPEDYDSKVASGPRKPSEGKTVSHNLKLTKGGKPTKKGLAIQVYNRGGDKTPYELNHYISEEENLQELSKELATRASEKAGRKADMAYNTMQNTTGKRSNDAMDRHNKRTDQSAKFAAYAAKKKKFKEEEKSGMPSWYEKEKAKSLTLQAMTAAKKKQQGKKIKQAIRNMKEEDLDEGVIRGTAELLKHGVFVPTKAAARAVGGTISAVGAMAGGVKNTVDDIKDAAKKVRAAYAVKKVVKKKKKEQLDEVSQEKQRDYHAKAGADLTVKRQKLERGTLTTRDFKKGQNRVKGLKMSAKKMIDEMEDKSVTGKGTITYKDPKTGKIKDYISPVTLNNPHMQASPDRFKMPNPVPLPPERPKIPVPTPRPKNLEENDSKKQVAKTPEKANFNIAKKLARQASKEALKKAMEKKPKK